MHYKLKDLRKKKHFTANLMANILDISEPFYSQLETEKRNLTYDMAIKIAKVFNLKPDDLFYEEHAG